ncbi:hypothetical protein [Capnocytophaga leadbetteri]|uniref:hypothetical protein n=1 Tax=Capnocytophaga leadbetteri TaxID=327575 RepID=UPI0026F04136|nr:hypothetical protein [Capnocytophaga leadbetteri]
MIGKFSNSVNIEQNNNGGNSGGGSGGNNSFPLPILEEDVFLQGNIGSSFDVMDIHLNQRERMGGAQPETDVIRQKDFNSTLIKDLYLEENFWGTIEVDSFRNFYVNPIGLPRKDERFYGKTIVITEEVTINIPTNKTLRILKKSGISKKLTIIHNGIEKEYVGSPAGTIFLVTPVFSSGAPCISEIRPFSFYDFGIN